MFPALPRVCERFLVEAIIASRVIPSLIISIATSRCFDESLFDSRWLLMMRKVSVCITMSESMETLFLEWYITFSFFMMRYLENVARPFSEREFWFLYQRWLYGNSELNFLSTFVLLWRLVQILE